MIYYESRFVYPLLYQCHLSAGRVASYKLLKSLGVDVDYPLDQTCCGQPMANAGFQDESLKMAIRFNDLFQKYDYIVGPSASCVAFVKENHPGILAKEGHQCQSADKIYDLCAFIHDVIKPTKILLVFPIKSVFITAVTVYVNFFYLLRVN